MNTTKKPERGAKFFLVSLHKWTPSLESDIKRKGATIEPLVGDDGKQVKGTWVLLPKPAEFKEGA